LLEIVKYCKPQSNNLIGILTVDNDDESVAQMTYIKSILDKYTSHSFIENISEMWMTYKNNKVSEDGAIPTFKLFDKDTNCLINQYPKEWMINEVEHDILLKHDIKEIKSIEPWWKIILGNKALLPMLWSLYPDHPNLLPAYYDNPTAVDDFRKLDKNRWVSKPLFGREGLGVLHSKNYSSF